MHCDQVLPVFLLYDQASQRLKAFGWVTLANITSPFWEHPPARFLQVSNLLLNNKQVKLHFALVLCLTYRAGVYFASCRSNVRALPVKPSNK